MRWTSRNLTGRLREDASEWGARLTTAAPTPVSPAEEPAVPSSAPESPVGPKVASS